MFRTSQVHLEKPGYYVHCQECGSDELRRVEYTVVPNFAILRCGGCGLVRKEGDWPVRS